MNQEKLVPRKLKKGEELRIISPSRSLGIISETVKNSAISQLNQFGFKLSFGEHVNEMDEFNSSTVASRVSDLHDAFSDPNVAGILTVIGGYNVNQILDYIDYDLIKRNPKVLCGFSDITILANAIYAMTGLVTYLGPHFSSWGMLEGFEYSRKHFVLSCMSEGQFDIESSNKWSDDPWYENQIDRDFIANDGYWVINEGAAEGKIVGGHSGCFSVLQGTKYWPGLDNSILLQEIDSEMNPLYFDRYLQSIIHQKDFDGLKGILIGRFRNKSNVDKEMITKIVKNKKELKNIPVIANVDFGHTTPIATFPIGGTMKLFVDSEKVKLIIKEH